MAPNNQRDAVETTRCTNSHECIRLTACTTWLRRSAGSPSMGSELNATDSKPIQEHPPPVCHGRNVFRLLLYFSQEQM